MERWLHEMVSDNLANDLLIAIERCALLDGKTFCNVNIDELLDSRDQPSFELEWLQAFDLVRNLHPDGPRPFSGVAEMAFKRTFHETANPDLAGYVSDDFDLIARALSGEIENAFIKGMLLSYINSKIPGNPPNHFHEPWPVLLRRLRQINPMT